MRIKFVDEVHSEDSFEVKSQYVNVHTEMESGVTQTLFLSFQAIEQIHSAIQEQKEQVVAIKINETLENIKAARKAHKDGEISKEALRHYLIDQNGALTALRWVLGENKNQSDRGVGFEKNFK